MVDGGHIRPLFVNELPALTKHDDVLSKLAQASLLGAPLKLTHTHSTVELVYADNRIAYAYSDEHNAKLTPDHDRASAAAAVRVYLCHHIASSTRQSNKDVLTGKELEDRVALVKLDVHSGKCSMPPALSSDVRVSGSKTLDTQVPAAFAGLLVTPINSFLQTTLVREELSHPSGFIAAASSVHFFDHGHRTTPGELTSHEELQLQRASLGAAPSDPAAVAYPAAHLLFIFPRQTTHFAVLLLDVPPAEGHPNPTADIGSMR